jgi:HlyD family secretion protein
MSEPVKWQSKGINRWRQQVIPGGVWLVVVATIAWLFIHRSAPFVAGGMARGEQREIAADNGGRLLSLPVRLFEEVRLGQTLAVLEDDRIQAQLATAAAETARLRAELSAAEDRLPREAEALAATQAAAARRFALDVEQTRIRELELVVSIETDRITQRWWQYRVDRLMGLRDLDSAATDELENAQTTFAALQKQIAENEKSLSQLRLDLTEARQRRDSFAQIHPTAPAIEKALEPLRAAVTVQERRITELSIGQAMLVLRSPIDGVVSELLRRPGETVMPGQAILTVSMQQPMEIVAFATANQVNQINVGMPVELALVRCGSPTPVARSRVIGIGPAAQALPVQLWQNPTTPEWGWPIGIAMPTGLPLMSGETLVVRGL